MKTHSSTKWANRNLLLLSAGALVLLLNACDASGTIYRDAGDPDPTQNQFLIQAIGLSGTTLVEAKVTIEGVDDLDGTEDSTWLVDFLLDDGGQSNSLPLDDGERQTHSLRVKAVQSADQQEFHKKVTITLYD
ncbi:MAG: hypothetical protein JRF33_23020 [Deltaproteobacteria bacterium]|nr:hypothetical protein [Deltaproteobacteria bacterium]